MGVRKPAHVASGSRAGGVTPPGPGPSGSCSPVRNAAPSSSPRNLSQWVAWALSWHPLSTGTVDRHTHQWALPHSARCQRSAHGTSSDTDRSQYKICKIRKGSVRTARMGWRDFQSRINNIQTCTWESGNPRDKKFLLIQLFYCSWNWYSNVLIQFFFNVNNRQLKLI